MSVAGTTASQPAVSLGDYLRAWRRRRRWSQLELALESEVSQRHLSFVESGRAVPSREMLLRLAERLDVPLRARNNMLLAAGYAPVFPEHRLADAALAPARQAFELVLQGHEPYPALVVDGHWSLVSANGAVAPLMAGIAERSLLEGPVNVLRLSLHPGGLAPRIANLSAWRRHVLDRLRHQLAMTGDTALAELFDELSAYPAPAGLRRSADNDEAAIVVPLELDMPAGRLSLLSTTTLFGTPRDVTLSELALESFFPANAETAERLRQLAAERVHPA